MSIKKIVLVLGLLGGVSSELNAVKPEHEARVKFINQELEKEDKALGYVTILLVAVMTEPVRNFYCKVTKQPFNSVINKDCRRESIQGLKKDIKDILKNMISLLEEKLIYLRKLLPTPCGVGNLYISLRVISTTRL
jgi:hypothetical protein